MKNLKKSFLYLALLLGYSNVYADVKIEQNPLGGQQDPYLEANSTLEFKSTDYEYAPNMYLALSVEFPTAGAAYAQTQGITKLSQLVLEDNKVYKGYFDSYLCYRFDETEKAFIPTSTAKATDIEFDYTEDNNTNGTSKKTFYGCNLNGRNDEFSGNVMNFLTMSAIDELRYVLTGGNRAWGVETEIDNYKKGEEGYGGGVYLRRANITPTHPFYTKKGEISTGAKQPHLLNGSFGYGKYGIAGKADPNDDRHIVHKGRYIDFTSLEMKKAIVRLVPHKYIPDLVDSSGNYSENPNYNFEGWHIVCEQDDLSLCPNKTAHSFSVSGVRTTEDDNGKPGADDYLRLHFINRDFGVFVGRRFQGRERLATVPDARIFYGNDKNLGFLPVVVNACNKNFTSSLGRDGKKCQDGKPQGLIHDEKLQKVNLAAFSYINSNSGQTKNGDGSTNVQIDGGVLRAQLSSIESQIDESTKSFILKPQQIPAAYEIGGSDYASSGAINYVNRFGDKSGYRGSDPVAELYYDVSRYIRGLADYSAKNQKSIITGSNSTEYKDNFPIIQYKGDYETDPLIISSGMSKETYEVMREAVLNRGKTKPSTSKAQADKDGNYDPIATYNSLSQDDEALGEAGKGKGEKYKYRQAACRINNIILIGDTYTGEQQNLPNTTSVINTANEREDVNNKSVNGDNAFNAGMEIEEYTKAALDKDASSYNYTPFRLKDSFNEAQQTAGNISYWGSVWGGAIHHHRDSNSPAYGVGVAYWLRANDNRKDLLGEQRATNYIIDVLENYSTYGGRPGRNQFFSMAKWGGFQLDVTRSGQPKVYGSAVPESSRWNTAKDKLGLPIAMPKEYIGTIVNDDGREREGLRGKVFGKTASSQGGYVIDQSGAFYLDIDERTYFAYNGSYECKDNEGNVIPNESNFPYEQSEYGNCPFRNQSKKEEYKKLLESSTNLAKNNVAKTVELFKKEATLNGGVLKPEVKNAIVTKENFPYNLAAGSDPDALEYSLRNVFNSALDLSTGSGGGGGVPYSSYAQAPVATSSSLGITICKESELNEKNSKCSDDSDPDNPITNEVVAANYDLRNFTGDVFKTRLFVEGSTTVGAEEDRVGSLLAAIQNSSGNRSKNIYTLSPADKVTVFNLLDDIDEIATEDEIFASNTTIDHIMGTLGTIVNSNILDIGGRYLGVASNDGIYHIMDKNLNEIFGYIPSTAWAKLRCGDAEPGECDTSYDKQTSHIYINDGQSFYMEEAGLVIGTTGRGGNAIYAIDVSGSTPKFAWEFSPDNLGLTINTVQQAYLPDTTTVNENGKERVVKVLKPVLVVSSGYNVPSGKAHIFILDTKGNIVTMAGGKKAEVEINTSSSLGSPFAYDHDGDDILDAIFVGDFAGNLWAISYAYKTTNDDIVVEESLSAATNLISNIQNYIAGPITNAPFVANNSGNAYVVFATGHAFNKELEKNRPDFGGLHDQVQNYGYGLKISNFKTSDKTTDGSMEDIIELKSDDPANPHITLRDDFVMPQFEDVSTAVGELVETGMKYFNAESATSSSTTSTEETEEPEGNWRVTFAKGYTPSLSQIVQRRLAVFMVAKPNVDCPDAKPNTNGDISDENNLCDMPDQGVGFCMGGTTAVLALDLKSGKQYKGRSVFDTNGDNEIHSPSECEGYAGDCPLETAGKGGTSMIDPPASVIYIDDFLSTGGTLITGQASVFATLQEEGITKRYNGAILSGASSKTGKYGPIARGEDGKPILDPNGKVQRLDSDNNPIPLGPDNKPIDKSKYPTVKDRDIPVVIMNRFGISSFIRNSLREIRR